MVRPSLFNAIHNPLGVGVAAGKAKYPMRSSTTLANPMLSLTETEPPPGQLEEGNIGNGRPPGVVDVR